MNLGDTEVLKTLVRQYGTKMAVMYYLKRAHNAGQRLKTNIAANNPAAIAADSQSVLDAIDMMHKILGDEKNTLEK